MVLQKILEWSEKLPDWQSDALVQLLSKPELQKEDIDRLYALLKAEHGTPDPEGRTAVRLSASQIPMTAPADLKVELLEVRNLRRVNAIAEHQGIELAPSGLTVVYGDNGSGKSGYSRVLKRACRARDQAEPILPDARQPGGSNEPAEAEITYSVDGGAHTIHWVDGEPADDNLSCINILDARCARAYLDEEDGFSYIPYGMDVFERLATLCGLLDDKVDSELEGTPADLSAFSHLVSDTEVGKLISELSPGTEPEAIESLGVLKPADESRLDELTRGLREGDPGAKAQEFERLAARIEKVAAAATEGLSATDEAEATRLAQLDQSVRNAKAAAKAAAENLESGGSLLPGTGGEAWKTLFEAARAFSAESHPGKTFPCLGEGSLCPLCQQPLGEGVARLKRFDEFIHQEAARVLAERQEAMRTAYGEFRARKIPGVASEETLSELESLDKPLATQVRTFRDVLEARRASILVATDTGDWSRLKPAPEDVSQELAAVSDRLKKQALTLTGAADDAAREQLVREHAELVARRDLGKVKSAVLEAVQRLKARARLEACSRSLNTRSISIKSRSVAEEVVSSELAEALNREFELLGVDDLRVTLSSRPEKGKMLHKLVLEVPGIDNPGAILSEGEQRAVAIASFLAEVGVSGGRTGILFDDPVCSLDHRRRERVARRLVEEAGHRQVVILTHDLYFLWILMDEATKAGVPLCAQSVVRRAEGFGVAVPDLPFEAKTTSARVRELRQLQQNVAAEKRRGDDVELHRRTIEAYRKLRLAWERGVEEVLFGGVVMRFRKGVETLNRTGFAGDSIS